MKKLFIALSLFTVTATTMAADLLVDEREITLLPNIYNTKIEVNYGPRFAAVQPTTHISFSYSSCRQFKFVAEVEKKGAINFVKVKMDGMQAECRGLPVHRNYKLQLNSDFYRSGSTFLVLNPVGQRFEIDRF